MVSTTGGMRTTGVEGGMKVTEEEMTGAHCCLTSELLISFCCLTFDSLILFMILCLILSSLPSYEFADATAGVAEGQLSERKLWMVSICFPGCTEETRIFKFNHCLNRSAKAEEAITSSSFTSSHSRGHLHNPQTGAIRVPQFLKVSITFFLHRKSLEKVGVMHQGLKELLKGSVVGEERAGEGGRLDLLPGGGESEGHDRPLNED